MDDETVGLQAMKDRSLAYWTDPKNFGSIRNEPLISKHRITMKGRYVLGMALAYGFIHFI